ncbi:HEAT repeat domain-containing protein [Pontiella desulfatans]|uniref:hypothetical protein n=1 Tax=Pontiella desulfatans TaxID=2750659 RepID=UPI00109C7AD3|nr:hypothetical protein [Pontiella desulfatans]
MVGTFLFGDGAMADGGDSISNIVARLLELPSPPPDWREQPKERLVPVELRHKDKVQEEPPSEEELRRRERAFRAKLIKEAESARFDGEYNSRHETPLNRLAEYDWSAAKPILEKHAKGDDVRVAAYATGLLYKHGDEATRTELRAKLQSMVFEEGLPASTRAMACERVLESDWPGRDEYFLHLLGSLPKLKEGYLNYRPLENFVEANPDHWIPVLTEWVDNENRVAHERVVSCLVQFNLKDARADALRPLLPWLDDPEWAKANMGRLRLIQSLDRVCIPESVDGLMWVAGHDTGFRLAGAADDLAYYDATNAVPILKEALSREKQSNHRRNVIAAIHALNGFSDDELVEGIEAFAVQTARGNNEKPHEDLSSLLGPSKKSTEFAIGQYVAAPERITAPVVDLLQKRAGQLKVGSPDVAEIILQISLAGDDVANGQRMLDALAEPELSEESILVVLNTREMLREHYLARLREFGARGGGVAGIAAVLAGSPGKAIEILQGDDRDAQLMLLACARLVREPLPVEMLIARWAQVNDPLLGNAIERYLEADDSAEARAAILDRYPSEMRILGALQGFDPGHGSFSKFAGWEKVLRKRFSGESPPNEIHALLSAGYWGNRGQIVVGVRDGKGELTAYYSNGRYAVRELAEEELARLKLSIKQNNFDGLAPLNIPVCDGIQYEYVHLAANGGRRVYMNNPSNAQDEAPVYDFITQLFHGLEAAGGLALHYGCESQVDGFSVLHAAFENRVDAVWTGAGGIRVLVDSNDDDPPQWHRFENGRVGGMVPQPDACRIIGSNDDVPKRFRFPEHLNNHPWQSGTTGGVVRANFDGLWLCEKDKTPILLNAGAHADPIVSPDGRWVVAAKAEQGWAKPNILIRYDLLHDVEHIVDIPPAGDLSPIAHIPAHGKFLVVRVEEGSGDAEDKPKVAYYLLDPATGEHEMVEGCFSPLFDLSYRPLQPSKKPGFHWAAINHSIHGGAEIGLYDMENFAFSPVVQIPSVFFDSMDMWVDKERELVYVAVNGDLVRFALPRN